MTVLTLIQSSLRLIGKLGPGRGAGPSELTDALFVLNSLLDAWRAERLTVYSITRSTHALTGGQATYTIGTGGNFNVDRPVRIEAAGLITGTQEFPLELLTAERWQQVSLKSLAGRPAALYNDGAYPLSTLSIYPVPSAADTLALYTWGTFAPFTATSETVAMPPGYADALRYELAVQLAAEWQLPLRPDVAMLASEKKAAIQRLNLPAPEMRCDSAVLGRGGEWNIATGDYTR